MSRMYWVTPVNGFPGAAPEELSFSILNEKGQQFVIKGNSGWTWRILREQKATIVWASGWNHDDAMEALGARDGFEMLDVTTLGAVYLVMKAAARGATELEIANTVAIVGHPLRGFKVAEAIVNRTAIAYTPMMVKELHHMIGSLTKSLATV